MKRLIPKWIGKVQVPSNRNTSIQLLRCWADIIKETETVETMLKSLEGHLHEDEFMVLCQEISRHLLTTMEEKGIVEANNTMIFIGMHENTDLIGKMNGRIAQVMHTFFDHPDMKIGGSHPTIERPPQNENRGLSQHAS